MLMLKLILKHLTYIQFLKKYLNEKIDYNGIK